MRIAIVGAGLTGLTTALRLLQAGHQVSIWEAGPEPGGLASGFKDSKWDWPLERHYHHLFTSDTSIQKLAKELKISITFTTPKSSLLINDTIYPFDDPITLLKFPLLSPFDKLRLSASLAYLKFLPTPVQFENTPAKQWIIQHMGTNSWHLIWEPLLVGKFGNYADRISAAWFWARVYKRSRSLGYFQGGFQALVDALAEKIRQLGGKFYFSTFVDKLRSQSDTKLELLSSQGAGIYDRVVVTGPGHVLTKLVDNLPQEYLEKISWLHSLGAVNLVLALKQSFLTDHTYWLNINQLHTPFLAVVEHTNMIDSAHYGGDHLIYIGNYLPPTHEYFKLSEAQLIDIFIPHLQKINHNFKSDWIRKSWKFAAPFAQPIIPTHYNELLPSMQTPIPHLWWSSMQHVYPWDRGTNYAVEWGEKVAKLVQESQSY